MLDAIRNQPEAISVEALASLMRRHPNTVREHLTWLVDHGLARRVRVPGVGRGRPAWHYEAQAVIHPEAELAVELARQLAAVSPDAHEAALAAGRRWGRRLVAEAGGAEPTSPSLARRAAVEHLQRLGYQPQTDQEAVTVRLTRCPLLQAAHRHPEVVCAVHQGLIESIIDEYGGGTDGVQLQPFAEPGVCLLQLDAPGPTQVTDVD